MTTSNGLLYSTEKPVCMYTLVYTYIYNCYQISRYLKRVGRRSKAQFATALVVVICQSGVLGHAVKYGLLVPEQSFRRVKLLDSTSIENHHPRAVHDGVQPVSDGQNCTVEELLPNGCLDEVVRLEVHGRSGLVQDENLGLSK